ncbi:hypothetical protein C8R45DRAFT_1075233 [Mycena sanguinolenta]|nr:hypothetical protein C8R45DRAFT_1075233 [Mycena sanguinolenta]
MSRRLGATTVQITTHRDQEKSKNIENPANYLRWTLRKSAAMGSLIGRTIKEQQCLGILRPRNNGLVYTFGPGSNFTLEPLGFRSASRAGSGTWIACRGERGAKTAHDSRIVRALPDGEKSPTMPAIVICSPMSETQKGQGFAREGFERRASATASRTGQIGVNRGCSKEKRLCGIEGELFEERLESRRGTSRESHVEVRNKAVARAGTGVRLDLAKSSEAFNAVRLSSWELHVEGPSSPTQLPPSILCAYCIQHFNSGNSQEGDAERTIETGQKWVPAGSSWRSQQKGPIYSNDPIYYGNERSNSVRKILDLGISFWGKFRSHGYPLQSLSSKRIAIAGVNSLSINKRDRRRPFPVGADGSHLSGPNPRIQHAGSEIATLGRIMEALEWLPYVFPKFFAARSRTSELINEAASPGSADTACDSPQVAHTMRDTKLCSDEWTGG